MGRSEEASHYLVITMQVIIQHEAEVEISEAFKWYEEKIPGLGSEFLRAVDACLSSISRNPIGYQMIHNQIRRALLRKFPYAIFYVIDEENIVILACFHARRDPERWRDRI